MRDCFIFFFICSRYKPKNWTGNCLCMGYTCTLNILVSILIDKVKTVIVNVILFPEIVVKNQLLCLN